MSDFNWSEEETVFPAVLGVAVYKNERGEVVIRQESDHVGDDADAVIILPPSLCKNLIEALRVVSGGA